MNNKPVVIDYLVETARKIAADQKSEILPSDRMLERMQIDERVPRGLEISQQATIVEAIFRKQFEVQVAVASASVLTPAEDFLPAQKNNDQVTGSDTAEALSREQIFEKVREVLVDRLGVDDDEVTEAATIVGDLGAESIDFLDIAFKLEKEFDITIPTGHLFPKFFKDGLDEMSHISNLVQNRTLTEKGISEFSQKFPHLSASQIEKISKDPRLDKVHDLFTVEAIIDYIEQRVGQKKAEDNL